MIGNLLVIRAAQKILIWDDGDPIEDSRLVSICSAPTLPPSLLTSSATGPALRKEKSALYALQPNRSSIDIPQRA
jgi:hypothetical protein